MTTKIVVYGATGHTGRFVLAELRRRGLSPILGGRDAAKLEAVRRDRPDLDVRVASVDDPGSLDRLLDGVDAVINCAGPFVDTAVPLVRTAVQAGVHYLDVAAEQGSVHGVFERFTGPARDRGIVVLPAMAFFGGLSDLLATAAMGDWGSADEIEIAVALDSWRPTKGTRRTGERNSGRRLRFSQGRWAPAEPPQRRSWTFPAPFGEQDIVGLLLAESVVIPRHLQVTDVAPYINVAPLDDLRHPDTPPPAAADASGRSAQVFLVDVVVRRDGEERRATVGGRDIYAVTAPIVVEAVERVLDGRTGGTGVLAAGEAFDAVDFLESLGHNDPTYWLTR